ISVWKGACRRCPVTSAWILRIEDSTFIHERLFDALEFAEQEKWSPISVVDSIVRNQMPSRLAAAILQVDPISPSYPLLSPARRNTVCSQLSSGGQDWSLALRSGLCATPGKPVLQISLDTGELPCGQRGDVLACATVAGDVRLAARDFTFLDSG